MPTEDKFVRLVSKWLHKIFQYILSSPIDLLFLIDELLERIIEFTPLTTGK